MLLGFEATADELGAAQDAVVEGVYRVSASPTDLARVLGAIGSGAGVVSEKGEVASWRVAEAMWTGGMAARLMRERDLPPVAGRWIQGLTDEGSWRGLASEESTFSGGGAVGAMALVPRLVPREVSADAEASTKGWKAWVEGVGKLSLPERNRERLVLMALDAVLRDGADPMINKAAFDAVGELCGAVSWREGSEARGWLMRWFDSPGVTSGDLHAVTVALVGRVRAPGLDSTMALPGSADESARAELRDRYREAWGLEALGARDARASAWVEWAEEVKGNGRGQGGAGALARAVRLARVNLAAEAIAQGRTGYFKPSDADVAALEEGAGRSAAGGGWTGAPRRAPADVLTPEVAWAARYAGARSNIPVRRELLAGYVPSEEWIDLEASLIVQEAVRGSPDDVRGMARRIVETQRGRAAFVNALLNEVATMPAVKGNVALVAVVSGSRVPGVKDAGWRVGARRALVERLLELVAGTGERSTVDGLAALLEEAYAKRAALAGASPSAPPESAAELEKKEKGEEAGEAGEVAAATPGGVAPGAEESARALASRLALAARDRIATGREVYTLEEIRSRREGRLKLARGRVQEFAVEQLAVCETLAYVTAGEVPGRAERVLGILSQLAEERRGAKGVLEQVEACERAMTELWLVRLKGGSA